MKPSTLSLRHPVCVRLELSGSMTRGTGEPPSPPRAQTDPASTPQAHPALTRQILLIGIPTAAGGSWRQSAPGPALT